MASGKRPPQNPPGARRRRPPTVLNLEATEIEPQTVAAEPAGETPAQPEQVQQPPPAPSQAIPEDAFIPPPPVTPRAQGSEPPVDPALSAPPPQHEPPEEPPPDRRSPDHRSPSWLPGELPGMQASAGIVGAVGALLVFLLLWLVGAFSSGHDSAASLGSRLATIEKQLNEIAARPLPQAGADPKALDAVTARVASLESAQTAPRAPVTDPVVLGRLSATENALKSLADNVAGLSRRADAADASLRELGGRIDKLAGALTELQTTARATAAGSDRAARLAVTAAALRAAVERGDPFVAELAVAKPLASDAGALAPLEPFALAGLPSNAALGQELAAILQPVLRTSGEPPRGEGFIGRLQANAEKIVRIRPVDDARGDDRGAALARVEQRAVNADIPGALAELAKLPPAMRAPAEAWIGKVEARNKAVEAGRRFAADAVAALKTSR